MSNNDEKLTFHAFNLGCEIASHALGKDVPFERVLELLQSIADGAETLLESPSDTASWFQRQEQNREFIVENIGAQAFENMRLHAEQARNSDFAQHRESEISLANAVLDSLHGRTPPAT